MSQTQENSVSLRKLIAPKFHHVHHLVKRKAFSTFDLAGGRGSTKSSFVAIEMAKGIMEDQNAFGIAYRKVGETIRTSILPTLEWAVIKLEVQQYWRSTTSPPELIYLPTGQKISCHGLDDPLKSKSIKPRSRNPRAYYKYLWFEEKQEYNGDEELRSVRQSVLRGGSEFIEFGTYNPPPEPEHWVNEEARIKRDGRYTHLSTYLDVDKDWLGPKFLEDAGNLQREKYFKYCNEYLGEQVGNTEEVIFGTKARKVDFEVVWRPRGPGVNEGWTIEGRPVDGPYFGADFGFSTDPIVLLKMWVEVLPDKRMRLWIEYDFRGAGDNFMTHGVHVEIDDTPRLFDEVPGSRKARITGDSSRPELISYLRAKGFDIVGAEKGENSVEEGVDFLLNFVDINIHSRCRGMLYEVPRYKYKVDRLTKRVTRDIVDRDNHGWDAARYGIEKIIKRRVGYFSKR